jgi:hypothetical protein
MQAAVSPDDAAGGTPCPWCGTANPAGRHFCRRCASRLGAAQAAIAPRSWWRQLLDRRGRPLPYAGSRPRLRHGPGGLVRFAAWACVLVALAVLVATQAGRVSQNVANHFAHPVQVSPATLTASRWDPDHPPRLLDDGYSNTWWGTGVSGDGAGTHVDATFAQPIGLLDLAILPGMSAQADQFGSEARPQDVTVTLVRADGHAAAASIVLADTPGFETFQVRGTDIVSVRLTLASAYGSGLQREVAIAEIQFFARNPAHTTGLG